MIPGLYVYTFSTHSSEYQPSGYANMTLFKPEMQVNLDNSVKQVKLNDIVYNHIYARSYNIMRFISGIGGLAF